MTTSRSGGPAAVVTASATAAFVFYSAAVLAHADRLLARAYDQAFFEELVWNVGHGGGFLTGFTNGNFLGVHFEPILVLPALLELAWPDARLLTILNAFALAAAAPAGFLLARELLPNRPWLAAALAAPLPLWATIQQAALANFHPEAMALPAALLAGWAGIRGHSWLCWCLALVALTAKEDQAYTVLVVGLLIAAAGRRRLGLQLAGAALLYGLVVIAVVMPAIRGGVRSDVASYYGWLVTAHPIEIAGALIHPAGWLAFAILILGMSGLPLLRWRWLALALPPFIADLLSHHAIQPDLRLHYGLLLVVPIFLAGLMGARTLAGRGTRVPFIALALVALLVAALATPFAFRTEEPVLARLQACTRRLPPDAPVAADDSVSAPLAARHRLAPVALARATDFLVLDREGRQPSYVDREGRERVVSSLPAGERISICADGRFELWGPVERPVTKASP